MSKSRCNATCGLRLALTADCMYHGVKIGDLRDSTEVPKLIYISWSEYMHIQLYYAYVGWFESTYVGWYEYAHVGWFESIYVGWFERARAG